MIAQLLPRVPHLRRKRFVLLVAPSIPLTHGQADRLLTNCAFELAYRLISGSKSEKAAWAGEIFTLEVFGEDAEELRESFVNLSGSGFFQVRFPESEKKGS